MANRKETIVNQNVECFTHAVPHISPIRLDLNTFRLTSLCQRLAARVQELLAGLLLGVAKDGREHSHVEKFDPSSEPSVVDAEWDR